VNGLKGLPGRVQGVGDETDASIAGEQLLAQTRRLLASDVIWTDSFQEPPRSVLQDEGIEGSTCLRPSSSRPTTSSARARSRDLAADPGRVDRRDADRAPRQRHRVREGAPERTAPLDDDGDDHQGHRRAQVRVGVEDTGESQEVRIKVTLTIPKQPDPIIKTATIPIIEAGETKAVVFTVGALVPFGEQTSVKVDVDPVPGETNTTNNTAEYPVIFTL
jgi:hypothetical protein